MEKRSYENDMSQTQILKLDNCRLSNATPQRFQSHYLLQPQTTK
jgi:hypothetical protein